MDINRVTF